MKYCWELMQKLQEAILNTQKNAKIQVVEDTPIGNVNSMIAVHCVCV